MDIFPKVDRVIYQKNPLQQVGCQFHFFDLLEIEGELPTEFQRRIRNEYPVYDRLDDDDVARYQFSSPDGLWQVQLTRHSLSLVTTDYERWEEFAESIESLLNTLADTYDVPSFAHISLRYVDVIDREQLGLEGTDWSELIDDAIGGLAIHDRFEPHVSRHDQRTVLELNKQSGRDIRSGLAFSIREGDEDDSEQEVAIIDNEIFCPETTESTNGYEILDRLHTYSGPIFRGCITEQLHRALDPEQVEPD